MTPLEIEFIEKIIGSDQKPYYYYRDKYALQLIQYHVKDSIKIHELKRSRYQGLLSKPVVRDVLRQCGDQVLIPSLLHAQPMEAGKHFNYTLSRWGEYIPHRNDTWNQTSRPGLNLVLQLNFDPWHNYRYHDLIRNDYMADPFVFSCHPIALKRQFTMAWARLDIDLDQGEMLIEEVQNDWLREVNRIKKAIETCKDPRVSSKKLLWFALRPEAFGEYFSLLESYQNIWDEATLSLAVHFAKQELGVSDIYYHDFDSGNLLKGLEDGKPPRSLYTKLPKRFCFEQTDRAPEMIRREKYVRRIFRKQPLRWWKMNI